mmetsp:Transcript_38510/g.46521  ORF Transcript_38510/g.46521 Transcript_38510/m.46521 type:complete len:263 (+) Transcript_38510:647-1435(+)
MMLHTTSAGEDASDWWKYHTFCISSSCCVPYQPRSLRGRFRRNNLHAPFGTCDICRATSLLRISTRDTRCRSFSSMRASSSSSSSIISFSVSVVPSSCSFIFIRAIIHFPEATLSTRVWRDLFVSASFASASTPPLDFPSAFASRSNITLSFSSSTSINFSTNSIWFLSVCAASPNNSYISRVSSDCFSFRPKNSNIEFIFAVLSLCIYSFPLYLVILKLLATALSPGTHCHACLSLTKIVIFQLASLGSRKLTGTLSHMNL